MQVIESEVHEVELTIPFYIQHDYILSINPKEYIRTQCESFEKSILLECNSSILQTSYHIQKEQTVWKVYSINSKHDHVDGIANLHYILQCYYLHLDRLLFLHSAFVLRIALRSLPYLHHHQV